jgi:rhamnogalacturonyl hydrolase YesR
MHYHFGKYEKSKKKKNRLIVQLQSGWEMGCVHTILAKSLAGSYVEPNTSSFICYMKKCSTKIVR